MSTRNSTMELVISIIALLIILVIYAVLAKPKDTAGVLYMIGNDQPVCSGVLHTVHTAYGKSSSFTCYDGREIKQVTNYILK